MRKAWLPLAVCLLACWAAGLGVRALELPAWDAPGLRVDGEVILSTHDAYAWVAGARGVGTGAGSPMAALVDLAARAAGAPLGNAAFWLSGLLGGLVGAAVALWGWSLAGGRARDWRCRACAALCAGLAGSLAPGFYLRTRLGWYDTDLVTLLLPLVQAWALAHWLTPWLRPVPPLPDPGDAAGDDEEVPGLNHGPGLAWPLAAGLLVRLESLGWHASLNDFASMTLLAGLVLVPLLGRPGRRARLAWGLAVFGLAGFGGLPGLAVAVVVLCLDRLVPRGRAMLARPMPAVLILLVLVMGTGLVRHTTEKVLDRYRAYTKTTVAYQETGIAAPGPASDSASGGGPVYPGVIQSVREAQSQSPRDVLGSLSAAWWLSALGLAGFAAACLVRPALLLLAPLAVLSLAGTLIGARTTMFGGPAVALGLALPLCWLARRATARFAWGRSAVLALGLLAGGLQVLALASDHRAYGPSPILTNRHVQALRVLGRKAPADALVWTWWDYGYATQYFSGLRSFADGARHGGRYLFPLGVAMATDSPMQSAQVMGYAALKQGSPWEIWDTLPAGDVRAFVHSMARQRYDLSEAPPSYLVVCWENVPLMPWITYFGSWDVVAATGRHGNVRHVDRDWSVDREQGALLVPDEEPLPLADATVLDGQGRRSETFRDRGAHLVRNELMNQAMLLDERCWRAMLFRLLVTDPSDPELAPWFRLVFEGAPLVRVFEVLYPGAANGG